MRRSLIAPFVALALPLAAGAQQKPQQPAMQQAQPMTMTEVDTRDIKWSPIEIPGFPTGVKIAPLSGNPDKAGDLYTLRLRFPDAYAFPAHWHPMAENLTVISGTFYLAMGDKSVEGAAKRYVAGDFLNIPAKMSHFGRVAGETIVQLHGSGPFQIMLSGAAAK